MYGVKEIFKPGEIIVCVVIMGSRNPNASGWKYTRYQADKKLKSGYRYQNDVTWGMYPNASNYAFAKEFEKNNVVYHGRPVSGENAPVVV